MVGPRALIACLHNRARTFIYTTALAVPVAAAALNALRVLDREPQRRRMLYERVQVLHHRLAAAGLAPSRAPSHIAPVVIGPANQTVALAQRLWERGILAPAIRPPTVPEGAARIRLSVTALHTEAQINALVAALDEELPRVRNSAFGVRSEHQTTPHPALPARDDIRGAGGRTPHSASCG